MKKSTRILSVILALTMLLGIFSTFGSAYEAFTGAAIANNYNDIDKPTFSTEQYASMALDELDRMLAKENLHLTKDDIFIGELDVTSVNGTVESLISLLDSVKQLLPMLGTAAGLKLDAFTVGHVEMNKDGFANNYVPIRRGTLNNPTGGNRTDEEIIEDVIYFLYNNKDVLTAYVNHTFSLGALNSVVSDYLFDVRVLVIKLLYSLIDSDFDAMDDDLPASYDGLTLNTAINSGVVDDLLAKVVQYALFGTHKLVNNAYVLADPDDYEGAIWEWMEDLPTATVTKIMNDCNIVNTSASVYDFVETLIVDAFNYIAVPELNNVTRPWLRETCGITYDKDKMDPDNAAYVPGYDGEPYTAADLTPLASLFKLETMRIPEYNPSAYTGTFIDNFNIYFKGALENVVTGSVANGDFTWDLNGGLKPLLSNICSVAKWVLMESGDQFFEPYVRTYEASEIETWNNQKVVSYILRTILNESVSWMYIPDTEQTLVDVCYAAVEQLAWQDIPQFTYTRPSTIEGKVDKMLTILMDVAVYNLNQHFDMVVGSNGKAKNRTATSPASNAGSGLLEYSGDTGSWVTKALQICVWGVHNYGTMLTDTGCALNGLFVDASGNGTVGSLTIEQAWNDIDRVITSLIPLSTAFTSLGNVWLHQDIANERATVGTTEYSDVIRSLLFDYIIYPVLNIDDISMTAKIFARGTNNAFATKTIKQVLVNLVQNILGTIFPGALSGTYATLDAVVVNSVLATLVDTIISDFEGHKTAWIAVALPVVCDALDLTIAQEFGEMECYMPTNFTANDINASTGVSFEVYNGCAGLNTGYTNASGLFSQDNLYTYEITAVTATTTNGTIGVSGIAANNTLGGGASKTVTLTGTNITNNSLVTLTINYKVKDETNNYLANGKVLACTSYAYIDSTSKDDSDVKQSTDVFTGNNQKITLKATPSVYANKGKSLNSIASGYNTAFETSGLTSGTVTVNSVSGVEWLELDASSNSRSITGDATYSINPLMVADGFDRLSENYNRVSVSEKNFATYGNSDANATTRGTALYTLAANGRDYNLVAQSAAYDPAETYYKFDTNVDHVTNGVKYNKDNEKLIEDGTYTVTIGGSANGTAFSKSVVIFLYNDFGLASIYNNAVRANRQQADFSSDATSEWTAYTNALKAAGLTVLDPKECGSFANKISSFATLYTNLYTAIKNLDAKPDNAGVDLDGIKAAIFGFIGNQDNANNQYKNSYYLTSGAVDDYNEVEGWNNIQYSAIGEDIGTTTRYAYTYFGMRDYVPHDYKKFRDAKNDAESLIDSQQVYAPIAPENPGQSASAYEYNKYLEAKKEYDAAYAQYLVKAANIPALNPVDVAYALSMVNLTGTRLIALPGNNDKLNYFYTTYSCSTLAQGSYSDATWNEFVTARDFAYATISDSAAKPSQITEALSQLVRAYKRLCEGVSYTNLDAALNGAQAVLTAFSLVATECTNKAAIIGNLTGSFTTATLEAFADALSKAADLRKSELGKSEANTERVEAAAAALVAATSALDSNMGGGDVVIALAEPGTEAYDTIYNDFIFPRDDWSDASVPCIDNTIPDMTEMFEPGQINIITGVGVCYYGDDFGVADPSMVFTTLENCYAVWEANLNGSFSTGSQIIIYTDDSMAEEVARYTIASYGDINGDNTYTNDDAQLLFSGEIGEYLWSGDPDVMYLCVAGDIDGDCDPSNLDAGLIIDAGAGLKTICQDYDGHYTYGTISLV